MKNIKVGDVVAIQTGYGRGRLGNDYGVEKVVVVEVDPLLKAEQSSFRRSGEVDDAIVYTDKNGSHIYTYDYRRDPAGTPKKGIVLVTGTKSRHTKNARGEFEIKNVELVFGVAKRDVLGTWEDHEKALEANRQACQAYQRRQDAQNRWDDATLKAIKKVLADRNLKIDIRDEPHGAVRLSAYDLARILSLNVKERPE